MLAQCAFFTLHLVSLASRPSSEIPRDASAAGNVTSCPVGQQQTEGKIPGPRAQLRREGTILPFCRASQGFNVTQ